MSATNESFGRAVRRQRLQLDLTAEKAAEKASVAYKTWLRLEHGLLVRHGSYSKVDALFGLPPATTLRCWQEQDVDGWESAVLSANESSSEANGIRGEQAPIPASLCDVSWIIPDLPLEALLRLGDMIGIALEFRRKEMLYKDSSVIRRVADAIREAHGGSADQSADDPIDYRNLAISALDAARKEGMS